MTLTNQRSVSQAFTHTSTGFFFRTLQVYHGHDFNGSSYQPPPPPPITQQQGPFEYAPGQLAGGSNSFNGSKVDANGINGSGDPANRHQLMNNRLKSLIQSRQSNKSAGEGDFNSRPLDQQQQLSLHQPHHSPSTLPPPARSPRGVTSTPPSTAYDGQQQQPQQQQQQQPPQQPQQPQHQQQQQQTVGQLIYPSPPPNQPSPHTTVVASPASKTSDGYLSGPNGQICEDRTSGPINGHEANGRGGETDQHETITQEEQSFLLNTTTSTNISTSTTSTFSSEAFGFGPSSPYHLLPPSSTYEFFGTQSVIPAAEAKPSLLYPSEFHLDNGPDMDVGCGRALTQLDTVSSNPPSTSLLDLSDNVIPSYDGHPSVTSTVLPPVSTFLLPSFRSSESTWWTGLKSPTSVSDPIEPSSDQHDYSLTSLPASVSN